jgi:hypothetical protein
VLFPVRFDLLRLPMASFKELLSRNCLELGQNHSLRCLAPKAGKVVKTQQLPLTKDAWLPRIE